MKCFKDYDFRTYTCYVQSLNCKRAAAELAVVPRSQKLTSLPEKNGSKNWCRISGGTLQAPLVHLGALPSSRRQNCDWRPQRQGGQKMYFWDNSRTIQPP